MSSSKCTDLYWKWKDLVAKELRMDAENDRVTVHIALRYNVRNMIKKNELSRRKILLFDLFLSSYLYRSYLKVFTLRIPIISQNLLKKNLGASCYGNLTLMDLRSLDPRLLTLVLKAWDLFRTYHCWSRWIGFSYLLFFLYTIHQSCLRTSHDSFLVILRITRETFWFLFPAQYIPFRRNILLHSSQIHCIMNLRTMIDPFDLLFCLFSFSWAYIYRSEPTDQGSSLLSQPINTLDGHWIGLFKRILLWIPFNRPYLGISPSFTLLRNH